MDVLPHLPSLPRFPLSVILSYLQQTSCQGNNDLSDRPPLPHNRDALSLLLTTKRMAYAILPLFRVPKQACRSYRYQSEDGRLALVLEKYRFAALPIQDPRTLLDRLNTRRLRGRIALMNQLKKKERTVGSIDANDAGIEVGCGNAVISATDENARCRSHRPCYQLGRTIEELTYEEWAIMEIDHSNGWHESQGCRENKTWSIWPAHLELLRFLEDDCPEKSSEQSAAGQKTQRRIMPPFRFRKLRVGNVSSDNNCLANRAFGHDVSLLASYPRSGNTLLRTLLERCTSIVTGSDTRPDRTLSRSLAMEHDLVGEGLVGQSSGTATKPKSASHLRSLYQSARDPKVCVVKTHFPERRGWKPVKGDRVLLLVRNPYDAIDSYWNLCCTNTHTRSLDESVYVKYAEKFEALARHEIKIWCEFHYYWIDICERNGVPLLVVKYEDLVLNTESEMLRVIEFMMDHNDAGGSELSPFWKWRISHAVGKSALKSKPVTGARQPSTSTSNLGSYQPRSSGGGILSIGKSIRKARYSDSVLCHMHEVAVSLALDRKHMSPDKTHSKRMTLLQQFGYDVYTQKFPDNFMDAPTTKTFGLERRRGAVIINSTEEVRQKDDPFGRAMTYWRRGETESDTKPFPTIPR
ncbi:hypothetical protein ACHAWF_011544 [Thalassiosira exigua]